MTRILVVADDFTGACEMAAVFARPQLPIPIGVNTHTATPDAAVWVVNTETRNVTAEEARAKVEDLFTAGRKHPESILYKKIDSTLRGPIGSEVEALRSVSGCTNVLFAPALPSQGRTTVAGRQLVWGVPLEYTPAAQDPLTSAATSHIPTLLYRQVGVATATIGMETVDQGADELTKALRRSFKRNDYCVVDAATEHHLAVIARSAQDLLGEVLLVGTAGLARHIAKRWPAADTDVTTTAPESVGSAGLGAFSSGRNARPR